jgi:hypothetical protein
MSEQQPTPERRREEVWSGGPSQWQNLWVWGLVRAHRHHSVGAVARAGDEETPATC